MTRHQVCRTCGYTMPEHGLSSGSCLTDERRWLHSIEGGQEIVRMARAVTSLGMALVDGIGEVRDIRGLDDGDLAQAKGVAKPEPRS